MKKPDPASGNILFYLLIAIVLIGFLTVALRDNGGLTASITNESAAVKANEIIKYSNEVAQGISTLMQAGVSERDIRFAYPSASTAYGTITTNPQNQIFSKQGGNVLYRLPPAGTTTTATSYFFVGNRSMPQIGSDKADMTLTLGNLTSDMCLAINKKLGFTTIPVVTTCGAGTIFGDANGYATSPIVIPAGSFASLPVAQACMSCTDRGSENVYMSTILAR